MNKLHKSIIVGLVAVAVSTLGIQASDMLRGVEGNLEALVGQSSGPCGKGEKQLLFGGSAICMDEYEVSPAKNCDKQTPASPQDTQSNLNDVDCRPVSESEKEPWRFVSFTQAQQICARSGKRLPTNDEWYKAVSGLADPDSCVVDSNKGRPELTGSADCVSPSGIYDMVGNLWEWVDEEVVNGQFNGRGLPEQGYVASVDTAGVVVETSETAVGEFGKDYAWTGDTGVKAMIRGGFYGSGEDAGIFAQNLSVPLNFSVAGVGFRCVRDI